jgi:hypothetical protein
MKDQTKAPVDRTINPATPQPGAPYTVIPPVKPFTVRETDTEGDLLGRDDYQGARTPKPFAR